ncbi:MAG: hypothetical protein LBE80_07605, partial [Deltaproteobacteria bacterium]|nr:hypothetical protein [Deltaproteobacteria bacterium]
TFPPLMASLALRTHQATNPAEAPRARITRFGVVTPPTQRLKVPPRAYRDVSGEFTGLGSPRP